MKKSLVIPLMCLMVTGLGSCGEVSSNSISSLIEESVSSEDIYQSKTYSYPEFADYVLLEGRREDLNDSVSFDWSGSTLNFKCDVEGKVSVNVTSGLNNYDDSEEGKCGLTLFSVFMDGERIKSNIEVDNTTKDIVLYDDVSRGVHTFSLVRQTNVYMSLAQINSISIKGKLLKADEKKAKIEFIGDSYATGYSLQGVKEGGGYDSYYDDPIDAFAYQTGLNLNSEVMLTALSGAGFAYGYTDFTVPFAYKYDNYFRDKTKIYNPPFTPDIVVINLGTNDVAQVGFDAYHEQIKKGVKKLVDEVFYAYGSQMPIVYVTDETHENNDPVIKEAMEEMDDVDYRFISITTNNFKNNGHPDKACGHQMGEDLSSALKEYYPSIF